MCLLYMNDFRGFILELCVINRDFQQQRNVLITVKHTPQSVLLICGFKYLYNFLLNA